MRSKIVVIFIIFCFFELLANDEDIVVIEYEKKSEDPWNNDMDGHGEEGQGIASDRHNRWFYSNKKSVYIVYDKKPYFDSNYEEILSLESVNSLLKQGEGDNLSCNHLGDIDFVDGFLYVAVDQCKNKLNLQELDVKDKSLREVENVLINHYTAIWGNLSDEVVISAKFDFDKLEGSILMNESKFMTCSYNGSSFVVKDCYETPSFVVKYDVDGNSATSYVEFKTANNIKISSAAWVAYNPIDTLFYNQCPANVIYNTPVTQENQTNHDRNINSVCGFEFNFFNHSAKLKSIMNLGVKHPRHLSAHWSNQGATFAENGVFLYVHDDREDDYSENTGFRVYSPNYNEFESFNDIKIYNNPKMFAFGHIRYDAELGSTGYRSGELEGIHVWRNSPLGGDVHVLRIDNELGNTDDNTIWNFTSGDYDGDDVDDLIDNCPLDSNPNKEDWNNDGVGDACQDFDKDGKLDVEDNCPSIWNEDQKDKDGDGKGDFCDEDIDGDTILNEYDNCPYVENLNQENWDAGKEGYYKVGDACDDKDGDNWYDDKDACPEHYNENTCGDADCRHSTSECCIEARKDCDMDGDGRWDKELKETGANFYDDYAFSVSADWEKEKDFCTTTYSKSGQYVSVRRGTCEYGYTIKINGSASYIKDSTNKDKAIVSSYYCYCGNTSIEHAESKRFCGTDHAYPGEVWNKVYDAQTWQPLYTEGKISGESKFKKLASDGNRNSEDKIVDNPFHTVWEYLKDDWLKSKIMDKDFYRAKTPEERNAMIDSGDYPMLKLSFGSAIDQKPYSMSIDNKYFVNEEYFTNSELYQYHIDEERIDFTLAESTEETVDLIIETKPFFGAYILPGYGKWYWEMLRDYIGERPWWKEDLPFARQFEDIVKENLYESISRPSLFSRVSYNGKDIKVRAVQYSENYNQIFAFAAKDGIYYKENDAFKLAFSNGNGIFRNARTVQNGMEMRSAAVTVKGGEIYMAAGMTVTPSSQKRNASNSAADPAEEKPIRNRRFARIYFVKDKAVMEELAELPWTPEYITLFITNDRIHAMMMDETGETSVLEYSSDNNSWITLNTFDFGQVFSLNNIFIKNNKLYFTAPDSEGKTALFTWDNSNSFVEIAHLNSEYDSFIKPFEFADKIILADIKDISGDSVVSWELGEENVFAEGTIPIDKPVIRRDYSYCLKETGTALQSGLEQGGECVLFSHPWYNSFSAGAKVYSLAGKGDRLYVGTNNAIKVYDISEPTSPVLVSSFSTSSRVNDLEVYVDSLFAATNGGLYKLDASNDTLTQTLFISTFLNSQYKVEVYNGKLYVGEDNGIKVRDLDTLSVLTSVNNGSVLDFAIENGEIGLYKDSWFSPVQIRDAETLALKANEFFGCFEIEVGSSDGRFYLSCDDETYRFEDDGDGGISFTELSGDIRELQDVYTFDGYTYFYDKNAIWISTSNDVPALCGNGIVEGDEVCDVGQIDCSELDSNYVSGTATCNSTCDGYNTNNCSDDGW